jgi:hypothetical protein
VGDGPVIISEFPGLRYRTLRALAFILVISLGSAALHPRLYASTRLRGFGKMPRSSLESSIPIQQKIVARMGDDIGAGLS